MADRVSAMQIVMRTESDQIIERRIRTTVEIWRLRGWINNDWNFVHRVDEDEPAISLMFTLSLELRALLYTITESELRMGGLDALHFWLDTIEHDIRRRVEHIPEVIASAALIRMGELGRGDGFFSEYGYFSQERKSERKAKKLFIAIAGRTAYKILEAGAPLPILGSQGTDYHLFKRASYCVERPNDGARLCAVVPNVPLWDHLLGIKLMIEHDEPTFLKTANVSNGLPNGFSLLPGAINYFDPRHYY